MDENSYRMLLKALKACEKNYHSHIREFGKLDKTDIAFWSEQLADFTPERIERSFNDHIQSSSFFPTIRDIREGSPENPKRRPCEDHIYLRKLEEDRRLLPEPESKKIPMPDNIKKIFHGLKVKVSCVNN